MTLLIHHINILYDVSTESCGINLTQGSKQAATKPFKCAAIWYWLLSAQFLFRSHDFF